MVIEAVFEDETIKADVFRRLEQVCAARLLLASNTSSISITVLSGYVAPVRRQYFLGTHFFSPVSRMKLVEVIPGLDTAPQSVEAAMAACRAAGKTPIQVKDVVGFAVNRLLHGFLIEAMRLVEEGVASPADIDTACKLGLGHPIGPFEMMDIVSNSLVLQVQEVMAAAYGDRFHPSMLLKEDGQGRLRRKKGRPRLASLGQGRKVMALSHLLVEDHGRIRAITLNRPELRNAMRHECKRYVSTNP